MEDNKKNKSGLAIAGFVLGIIAVVFCFIPLINFLSYIFGILAIIFGAIPLIKKKSIVFAIIAVVLGIGSIFVAQSVNKATVEVLDDAVEQLDEDLSDATGENTDEVLENDVDVEFGEFTHDDMFGEMDVTITNKSDEQKSFSITVEAVDADGNRIEDSQIFINDLGAGQSTTEKAFTLSSSDSFEQLSNAEYKVVEVSVF